MEEPASKNGYLCINCNAPSSSLYQEYSKDVIRITECVKCGEVVDKYVEYDDVLLIMDLILQYIGAYRHLLNNTSFKGNPRLAVVFLFCGAYNKWIDRRIYHGEALSRIYDLEWNFYQCLILTMLEFIAFDVVILAFAYFVDNDRGKERLWSIAKCSLTGFYGNVFVVISIVWQLHSEWMYRILLQIFILTSHVQVHRTVFSHRSVGVAFALVAVATVLQQTLLYYAGACFFWLTQVVPASSG
ncbi:hypothetical protein QR680_001248 [Steinernema hermaphroditum]|uniref:Protein ARV n=1 Tax=Steinernema hermaphroditum TaxID=289476 RepID=A0AA39LFI1_9BILA|nr:hypothetical protein QR680_001248 [Steinernema hermaphroditum]